MVGHGISEYSSLTGSSALKQMGLLCFFQTIGMKLYSYIKDKQRQITTKNDTKGPNL